MLLAQSMKELFRCYFHAYLLHFVFSNLVCIAHLCDYFLGLLYIL